MIPLEVTELRGREAFADYLGHDPVHAERLDFERQLIAAAGDADHFEFDAWCVACERRQPLLVDRLYGAIPLPEGWLPNWRERLVCPSCGLNNRQRAMLQAILQALGSRADRRGSLRLYAMEQVTPFFGWLEANLPIRCVGSEYLGPHAGGARRWRNPWARIRHENAEALSFRRSSFDCVVSNDVLEHVDQPRTAVNEVHRVLKPGGELFLSLPFQTGETATVRRALLSGSGVQHLLPPQYHANPLSEQGSLVFHDFGWDLVDWLVDAGFSDASMWLYWSSECGYLGEPQYFFHAVKAES